MKKIKELTQKELRRLSRRELLTLLLEQAREIEELEEAIEDQADRYVIETAEKEYRWAKEFAVQKELEKAQLLFDSLMQQYFG